MKKTLFILMLLMSTNVASSASADSLSVNGHLKTFARYESYGLPFVPSSVGFWDTTLRLKLKGPPSLPFEAAYVLAPRVASHPSFLGTELFTVPDPFSYRLDDLNASLADSDDGCRTLSQNLDRLNGRVHAGKVDVLVGRQPVAFGAGRLVNPIDVLAPFPNQALDTEERVGVDAVRVRVATGDLSEVDAGVVGAEGDLTDNGVLFIKPRFPMGESDVAFMTMRFRRNLLVGWNLQRDLGIAGFWTEGARVAPYDRSEKAYVRVVAGLDRQLTERLYGWTEYHFNGAGRGVFAEYLGLPSSTAYSEGGVFLLGRHYASAGLTYQLHALVNGALQATSNISDGSAQVSPAVEISLLQDLYMDVGGFLTLGRKPALDITTGTLVGSEFQLYPDMAYTSLRYYF